MSAAPAGIGGTGGAGPRSRTNAELVLWSGVALAIVITVGASVTNHYARTSLALVVAVLCFSAVHRVLLAWPSLLGLIVAVVLFVPIKRYTMAGGVGFQLEPYRLLIGLVLGLWCLALLVDLKTRFRSTGLEPPIACFGLVVLLSLLLNLPAIDSQGLGGSILKAATFFGSFFLVMFFTSSVVGTRLALDRLLMLLVAGGAIVGLFAIIESRIGFNPFNMLDRVIPLIQLEPGGIPTTPNRDGRPRAYASAQHAIALGALLVMLLPLAIYLHRRSLARGERGLVWLAAALLLVAGALSSQSKTAVVMLLPEFLVFFWLRRQETIRLLPMLLPMLIGIQIVVPGTLGTIKRSFFPTSGSLVSEEQADAGQEGSGRLADVGPALQEWSRTPFFGQGFATRLASIKDGAKKNAHILDDQWLSSLLEVGAAGILALLWMFVRSVRRLKKPAKEDDSEIGWMMTGFVAAIIGYAIGMATFDAFAFIQVTVLLFFLLGLSAAALRVTGYEPARRTR